MEQVQRTEQRFEGRREEREAKKAIITRAPSGLETFKKLDTAERVTRRLNMINKNDGLGRERIINGRNDIVEVNYLDLGIGASQSICRIEVRDTKGEVLGHGTGFIVSPSLMLTNNHVLNSIENTRRSLAQFQYESNVCFLPKDTETFSLEPDRFF
jgi:endonuclease G